MTTGNLHAVPRDELLEMFLQAHRHQIAFDSMNSPLVGDELFKVFEMGKKMSQENFDELYAEVKRRIKPEETDDAERER